MNNKYDRGDIEAKIVTIDLHAEKIRAMQRDIENDLYCIDTREKGRSALDTVCILESELAISRVKNEIIFDYAYAIKEQCEKIIAMLYPEKQTDGGGHNEDH